MISLFLPNFSRCIRRLLMNVHTKFHEKPYSDCLVISMCVNSLIPQYAHVAVRLCLSPARG